MCLTYIVYLQLHKQMQVSKVSQLRKPPLFAGLYADLLFCLELAEIAIKKQLVAKNKRMWTD